MISYQITPVLTTHQKRMKLPQKINNSQDDLNSEHDLTDTYEKVISKKQKKIEPKKS